MSDFIAKARAERRQRFEFLWKKKLNLRWLDDDAEFNELRRLYQTQPEWAKLREAVRLRCGNVCENCHVAPYEECHHLTYDNYFCENVEELLGVCRPCHRILHPEKNKLTRFQKAVTTEPSRTSPQTLRITTMNASINWDRTYAVNNKNKAKKYDVTLVMPDLVQAVYDELSNIIPQTKNSVPIRQKKNHCKDLDLLVGDNKLKDFVYDTNKKVFEEASSKKLLSKVKKEYCSWTDNVIVTALKTYLHDHNFKHKITMSQFEDLRIKKWDLAAAHKKTKKKTEVTPEVKTVLRHNDEEVNYARKVINLVTDGKAKDLDDAIDVQYVIDNKPRRRQTV